MSTRSSAAVFDYRALRLLVGFIAFALPFVVSLIASNQLSSISASYHTEARDLFVGMLFFVSAFLWAYNGHSSNESRASKIAAIAAILVAIFPTSCDVCALDLKAIMHYCAAVLLFTILAYFCFVPFRKNTKAKGGKKGRRSKIYFICGCTIVGSMLSIGIAQLTMSDATIKTLSMTYWAEAIALIAFGIAWIVAGKYFGLLVEPDEALHLFGK
jgi:hypothetical protein